MLKWILPVVIAVAPMTVRAEPLQTLGWGRLFDNDAIGDGQDRWRTGSYSISVIRGTSWDGILPDHLGQLYEWRLRSEIIAPSNLADPDPGDRRYVGEASLGLHSMAAWQGAELSTGLDVVAIGPMTGLSGFQHWIHHALGMDKPDTSHQIGNEFRLRLEGELGKPLTLSDGVVLRPFVYAQAGVETMVRAGADLTIGHFADQAVMLRDEVTGQRYRGALATVNEGASLVVGGDIAKVFSSTYLPSDGAAQLEDLRRRMRVGVYWQGRRASVFYGATWLSREYQGQPGGQVVGSLTINFRF